jgi:hypothetical protein
VKQWQVRSAAYRLLRRDEFCRRTYSNFVVRLVVFGAFAVVVVDAEETLALVIANLWRRVEVGVIVNCQSGGHEYSENGESEHRDAETNYRR